MPNLRLIWTFNIQKHSNNNMENISECPQLVMPKFTKVRCNEKIQNSVQVKGKQPKAF